MNFLKSGWRFQVFSRTCDTHQASYKVLALRALFLSSQELKHDQEDLHKYQRTVEAAECQQCLCQAEEAHPHSPSRQKAEQK